jgi:exodeoxyribonuclease V gamma subunit
MSSSIGPGFITLHGNQLELLRSAVFDWLRQHPLAPLEQEIFLVQSNGVAEWLKIALAEQLGVCASTRVMLPARFLWESYRAVLGAELIARRSAFDKAPMVWRLMRLLPQLVDQAGFEPLKHFLADGDPGRRLQLAQRLADLMDQYQVYRADWLVDWAMGRDQLTRPQGDPLPLPDDQAWQARLWRAIVASVAEEERTGGRADVHRRFLDTMETMQERPRGIPRRVVLFGISALPYQTLQALGALASVSQVILAVPNPCQFHWGDIIQGREYLLAKHRRQQLRDDKDLTDVPFEELHLHCHPLLAGWGRLGRDFIRMMDEFDNVQQTREAFANLRLDLFSDGEGDTLLEQVQAAIRDMQPLPEHAGLPPEPDDRSIEFHAAHSTQREVEVLHDRLLNMLAHADAESAERLKPLKPIDIVVMVPDIETFTPAIRAVFGQYPESDARFIPFSIVDIRERRLNPLLVALDWLLQLPQQRCRQSEVRDLLDVPAVANRFGLEEGDLPRIGQWIAGAGVRWGLDGGHRDSLGLGPAGEQNAWMFGIRRMLLGYASGQGEAFAGIEPYAEIGGLEAALAGSVASFINTLLDWRKQLAEPATPAEWGIRARALLKAFFAPADERDRLTCAQLEQSLQCWLEDCEGAEFDEAVPLAVLREAWLGTVDEPSINQRFMSGGVTFCTLMPMRAVPYRVVCLLGMNEGDYPRQAQQADFDLLTLPGVARPGDRSRREDDRYLLLEALLAARDKLYISWVGRNVRDNSEEPPSVLIAQLQDYLLTGWNLDLSDLTTEHPLQPFSRRYFEPGGLTTYAREWRAAHDNERGAVEPELPPFQPDPNFRLQLRHLGSFVRQPVKYFFQHRLQVVFSEHALVGQDDEPFDVNALDEYGLASILLDDDGLQEPVDAAATRMEQRAARLARQGVLPIGLAGAHYQKQLVEGLLPARVAWLNLCQTYSEVADKLPVSYPHRGLQLEDWLDGLRSNGAELAWLDRHPGNLTVTKGEESLPRPEKLIDAWVRQLASAATGNQISAYVVGRDAILRIAPMDPAEAQLTLETLISLWRSGLDKPLPTACKTALALLKDEKPEETYNGGFMMDGESVEPCLARLWPEFESLSAEPEWANVSRQLYAPLLSWIDRHVRVMAPATDAQLAGAAKKEAA